MFGCQGRDFTRRQSDPLAELQTPKNGKHKMSEQAITAKRVTPIPPDDPKRSLAIARPNTDQSLPHIGLVGDTYTILLSGDDTGGRYCLIDMHIPPGGGPPPHRHDFEESFTILEGEIEATFRGEKSAVRAGETINIPANAPHSFTNASKQTVRLLCLCVPAGQEEFFAQIGVPVATRTTPPPKLDEAHQAASIKKAEELAPQYRTQL
jgi:quercetin dioxygenase-like cupin family protein